MLGEIEHFGLVDRDDRALDLVGKATKILEPFGGIAALHAHLGDQLAVIVHLDFRQPFRVLRHDGCEPAQQLAALARLHLTPRAGYKRLMRGRDHRIDIGRTAARNQRPWLAEKRIERLDPVAAGRTDFFTPDYIANFRIALVRHRRTSPCTHQMYFVAPPQDSTVVPVM